MKFVRISSILVGISMIGQWVFFLVTGNVPELLTTPVSIIFHIVIEIITALFLLLTGIFFLDTPRRRMLAVFCQGMLFYTVVNSSGYFAQSGQWPFLIMFALLLVVAVLNTLLLYRANHK